MQTEQPLEYFLIMEILQDFYRQYKYVPPSRILLQLLEEKLQQKVDNLLLNQLFPNTTNPIKAAAKLAGLPEQCWS